MQVRVKSLSLLRFHNSTHKKKKIFPASCIKKAARILGIQALREGMQCLGAKAMPKTTDLKTRLILLATQFCFCTSIQSLNPYGGNFLRFPVYRFCVSQCAITTHKLKSLGGPGCQLARRPAQLSERTGAESAAHLPSPSTTMRRAGSAGSLCSEPEPRLHPGPLAVSPPMMQRKHTVRVCAGLLYVRACGCACV